MPDILIRGVPDEVHARLKEKATSDGKALEAWLREQMMLLAAMPTIKKRYTFRAFGPNGAYATVKREHEYVQRGAKDCSQEQFDAFQRAALLAERNELNDYEEAYKLLLSNFEEVFIS